jgi:2-haloacid dehalogenase
MKHYNLIIFDLDDTLFDYKKTEEYAIIKTCESLGINFEGDLYYQYKIANDIIRQKFNLLDYNNIQLFRYSRIKMFFSLINNINIRPKVFINEYLEYSAFGILIEGVPETLENLKGISKVVATNGTNIPRQKKLESSSIARYFDAFFSAENLGVAKPNSEFFLKIIKYLDVKKDEVLSVGDDYSNDIKCAIETGIDSCWFNYRKVKITENLSDNVYVIEKFNEIIGIVK